MKHMPLILLELTFTEGEYILVVKVFSKHVFSVIISFTALHSSLLSLTVDAYLTFWILYPIWALGSSTSDPGAVTNTTQPCIFSNICTAKCDFNSHARHLNSQSRLVLPVLGWGRLPIKQLKQPPKKTMQLLLTIDADLQIGGMWAAGFSTQI